jgi:hypothetical protein
MRSVVSIRYSIVALFLCSVPVFGQQGTTHTDCNVSGSGQSIDCTSKTDVPPPSPADVSNKNMADWRARQAQAQAANRARRADAEAKQTLENQAEVNMVYCKQNPAGSVTTSEGKDRSCADELAYEKAFCVVNSAADRCNLPASEAEVEKAFADLIEKYKNDPGAKRHSTQMYYESLFVKLRESGCRSFPEMTLPIWGKPDEPCSKAFATALVAARAPIVPSASMSASAMPSAVSAPMTSVSAPVLTQEQTDAISYCKRNPSATITWNNGTVSPCSSVLGPR